MKHMRRWFLVAICLLVAIQVVHAQLGTLLRSFPHPVAGNGRGIAFDGTFLYYTFVGSNRVFIIDTLGVLQGSITVGTGVESAGGPLAWDGAALWTMN